jgi:hypothetical protein
VATVATRDRRWVERAVPIADLPAYATALRGATDTYVSQQAFYGWRRITQLAQLGALYSDLDYRNSQWAGEAPERVSDALLHELDEVCIPAPNYILATGRGLLATWLHDPVPRAALPRWNAAQDHLRKVLSSFGADPRALDAARVFRVSGTWHSGVDAIVRPIWMATSASGTETLSRRSRPPLPFGVATSGHGGISVTCAPGEAGAFQPVQVRPR